MILLLLLNAHTMHAVCESISSKCIIVLDAVRSLLSSYLVIYWWIESIQIEFHASHHNFIWVLVKWRLMIWCTRNTQPHIHSPHHTHDHLYTCAQCTHTHKKKKKMSIRNIDKYIYHTSAIWKQKHPKSFFRAKNGVALNWMCSGGKEEFSKCYFISMPL